MATVGLMPATMISSGVISEPPPIPVRPMRIPTPSPKTMMSGSMSGDVQPALGLVGARPAALAAAAGVRARRAADRLVAAVVQRVVGQVALADATEEIALGPVDERVVLPDPAALVELDVLGVGPRRPLLAADAGDPRVGAVERALERGDLGPAAAVVRARPRPRRVLDGDLDAEALLE